MILKSYPFKSDLPYMLIYSVLFIFISNSVACRRDISKFYSLVALLTTLSSLVLTYTIQELISYNAHIVFKTILIFIFTDILITLHHFFYNCNYKSGRDYSYSPPIIAFLALVSKKNISLIYNIISLAIYNNYQNITFKEINIKVIIRLLLIAPLIITRLLVNNEHIIFIVRFIIFLVIFSLLPFILKKYENYISSFMDNFNWQKKLYVLVYNLSNSLGVSIIILIIIYIISSNFCWELLWIESILNMLPWGQGNSNLPGGFPGSSSNSNPYGSGPRGPEPPQTENLVGQAERPSVREESSSSDEGSAVERENSNSNSLNSEETAGVPGFPDNVKWTNSSETFRNLAQFKNQNPNALIEQISATVLLDKDLNREKIIGYYQSRQGSFFAYRMHCFHLKEVRVYETQNINSRSVVMDACPLPKLYIWSEDSRQFLNLSTRDRSTSRFAGRALYCKNTRGNYVRLPLNFPEHRIIMVAGQRDP